MGHFLTKFIDVAESCVVEVLSILCSFRRAHARRFPQTPITFRLISRFEHAHPPPRSNIRLLPSHPFPFPLLARSIPFPTLSPQRPSCEPFLCLDTASTTDLLIHNSFVMRRGTASIMSYQFDLSKLRCQLFQCRVFDLTNPYPLVDPRRDFFDPKNMSNTTGIGPYPERTHAT